MAGTAACRALPDWLDASAMATLPRTDSVQHCNSGAGISKSPINLIPCRTTLANALVNTKHSVRALSGSNSYATLTWCCLAWSAEA